MEGRGGGAEVQAWLLARELARRGNAVSYVAQSVQGKAGQEEVLDGVRLRWVRYAHHFRWANGIDYYRALSVLNPDVVIQRMTSFITGVAGLYCKRHKKRFVWICTDNQAPARWSHWRNQVRVNREQHINMAKRIVFLANAFIYDMARHWGMKQVTHPFTQNDFQRKILAESFGMDSHRMISGHEPPKNSIPPEERLVKGIVLWVASLSPRKRPEKFLELARMNQNSGLRFVMIGGRLDKAYIDVLFQDKTDNVEWLGQLPFDETLEWFDQAMFFVNTSEAEGFPNTFIQAWLRGVPVFSLGVDPNGVIQRNNLGCVAETVQGLFQNLKSLSKKVDAYSKMSVDARKYGLAHHAVKKMVDHFLSSISDQES